MEVALSPKKVLEEGNLVCDICRKSLLGKRRFCCLDCSRGLWHDTYDVCDGCVEEHKKKDGQHFLKEGVNKYSLAVYESLAETITNRFEVFSFLPFVGVYRDDEATPSPRLEWVFFYQIWERARSLATWIQQQQDVSTVAMCLQNGPMWSIVDTACILSGVVSASISKTEKKNLAPLLRAAQASVLFCDFEYVHDDQNSDENTKKVQIIRTDSEEWEKIISSSSWLPIRAASSPSDPRALVFTSGSTGQPKASVLTDADLLQEFVEVAVWRPVREFGFQPLSYTSQRLLYYGAMANGGTVAFWNGEMQSFFVQLQLAQVSSFSAPPAIWQTLYSMHKSGEKDTGQILAMLGSHCRSVVTGGATTPPVVLKWMEDVFQSNKIMVYEGYGCTEAGAIAYGGVRVWDCQVHLEEIPDMGYTGNRGLLWVCTPQTDRSVGYWKDSENTTRNYRDIYGDGRIWFNTGDVVEYEKKRQTIRVIDRVKNVVKLANARFVSPEFIEGVLVESPFVSHVFVFADPSMSRVAAVVRPNALNATVEKISQNFSELAAKHNLHSCEVPGTILIEQKPWTPETGELTSSFKINRPKLNLKYKSVFANPLSQVLMQDTSVIDASKLDLTKTLAENGVDSVTILRMMETMKSSGVQVNVQELITKPISDVAGSATNTTNERISYDLPAELVEKIATRRATTAAPSNLVILTGASGFLGSFILRDLKRAGYHVLSIERSTHGDLFDVPFDPKLNVCAIVHCAARVNSVFPYSFLKRDNVDCTLKLLDWAVEYDCPFVFISSISAVSSYSGYGVSKRVSEIHLEKAFKKGFRKPIVVLRPGSIGPSEEGQISMRDLFGRFVSTIMKLGVYPDLRTRISLVSVEDVSANVCELLQSALQPNSPASFVCHSVCGPGSVTVSEIGVAASAKAVSYEEFLSRAQHEDTLLTPLVPEFSQGFLLGEDEKDDQPQRRVVVKVDQGILQKVLDWIKRQQQ